MRLRALGVRIPHGKSPVELRELLKASLEPRESPSWITPVVLSGAYEVFDFTVSYDASRVLRFPYGWGRYDEDRVGMYNADFFLNGTEARTIHMGVDLGAPAGTSVFSPVDATFYASEFRDKEGDYGGTVILRAEPKGVDELPLYFLFGHLSRASLKLMEAREAVEAGELIGWLGEKHENGGWNPHLHLQLSRLEPTTVDLPGAVSSSNRDLARVIFPDPSAFIEKARSGWPTSAAVFA